MILPLERTRIALLHGRIGLDKFLWYGKRAGLLYHSYTYAGPMCLYFLIKTFLVSVWAYMCNHRELLLCDQLLEEFQSIWPIGHILTSCLPPFHLPLSLSLAILYAMLKYILFFSCLIYWLVMEIGKCRKKVWMWEKLETQSTMGHSSTTFL